MATFRSKRRGALNAAVLGLALAGLACLPRDSASEPPAPEVAAIVRQGIDPVSPKRDFVGPAPARLEWTAVAGVDSYDVIVVNEIDRLVLEHRGAAATAIDWPKEIKLEPGTYFWRVTGMQGGRSVADSGRSAFVVMN